MKGSKQSKEKYKIYSLRRTGEQKCEIKDRCSSAQGDKSKEKPDAKWNKGSSDPRTKPYPAKLSTCEREF